MALPEVNIYPEDQKRIFEPFPYWYTPVKWFLPILLGCGAASVVGAFIAGIIPAPQALGMIQLLPVIYGTLQGVGALAMLGICSGLVGSLVALSVAFFVRATVLFQVNELRATQGEACQERVNFLSKTISKQGDQIADLSEDNLYFKNFAYRNRPSYREAHPETNELDESSAPMRRNANRRG